MKQSRLYYNGIFLGTLYSNGIFNYMLDSSYAERINMELVLHQLEMIREVGKQKDFDFDKYIQGCKEFPFSDGFEWKEM